MDLCSGSGTGLASALALGRHCIAVEKDIRQSSVLKGRVLSLVANLAGDESGVLGDGEDEDIVLAASETPFVGLTGEELGSDGAGPSGSGGLGTDSMLV